jgi:hypothetical protein
MDVTTVAVGLAKDIFEAALANRAGRIVDSRRISAAQFGQFVDSLATGRFVHAAQPLEDMRAVRRRETAAAVTTSRAGRAECPRGQLSCP